MSKRNVGADASKPKQQKANSSLSDEQSLRWDWQGASESPSNSTRGLLKLSPEIMDEILSYLGCTTNETHVTSDPAPVAPLECLERTETLRALSQTCVAYRTLFLPMAWYALEVCCDRGAARAWYRNVGTELRQRSTLLKNRPELAQYVRVVRVVLTHYQRDIIPPAFASCLVSLPNVHTLHLLHVYKQMTTILKKAFESIVLPTVRTIILPDYAHEVLRSCPNVTYVRCIADDGSKLIAAMQKACPKVEVVTGIPLWSSSLLRISNPTQSIRFARMGPGGMRPIGYREDFHQQVTETPSACKSLRRIEFDGSTSIEPGQDFPPHIKSIVTAAQDILRASPARAKKIVRIWYRKTADPPFIDIVVDS